MSLKMARQMVRCGIQNVVATPHGAHPGIETHVDPDFLREQVARLAGHFQKEDIPLNLYPGTEVFLRGRVVGMLDRGELISWADQGKFLLVELGFQRPSESLFDVIEEIFARGLTPIIAHPERYVWLPGDVATFVRLRDMGCVFQFNMMSINGHFGPRLQAVALGLMQCAGEYLIGSDSHSDAGKYFDFAAAKEQLRGVGLLDDRGIALPGSTTLTPVLDGLPS
jgi:protein-tyrosine phosphatase